MSAALPLSRILLFAAIPAITMSVGGALSTVWEPGRRMQSLIQHFAAGVVFAVVAGELLPEFVHAHAVWSVATGFASGVALMLALRLLPGGEPPDHLTVGVGEEASIQALAASGGTSSASRQRSALGLLVPIGIDSLLDGVLIGIGFTAESRTGVLLTVALALEMFSMGLALATTLHGTTTTRHRLR